MKLIAAPQKMGTIDVKQVRRSPSAKSKKKTRVEGQGGVFGTLLKLSKGRKKRHHHYHINVTWRKVGHAEISSQRKGDRKRGGGKAPVPDHRD